MTVTNLFGVALAPLCTAIAEVESNNGETSDNIYQISVAYVEDVNRITGNRYEFTVHDRYIRWVAERMMVEYWQYYGNHYVRQTGKQPTAEILARIHNGGPNGYLKPSTEPYWLKVKACLAEGGAK